MKKRSSGVKGTSGDPAADVLGGSSAERDLKSRIREHSAFFDRLVELIPARFYLPAPDDRPWYLGLSKAAKASFKKETRENLKKARRARFDPENASSTVDVIRKNIEAEKSERLESNVVTESESSEKMEGIASSDRNVTYEELRERLRSKIEALRSGRNTRNPAKQHDKKEKIKNKSKKSSKKVEGERGPPSGKRKLGDFPRGEESRQSKKSKGDSEVGRDFAFGTVRLGGSGERANKRKLSKVQELERAKRLESAKKDPEKGGIVSKKHQWEAAVNRAAGVKVHDDPKLLQESIKKEKKRREKHAKQWKERIENTKKAKEEKQRTRSENITEKIKQKKMKRIDKREKKLMRPGFEGRKEGYINE